MQYLYCCCCCCCLGYTTTTIITLTTTTKNINNKNTKNTKNKKQVSGYCCGYSPNTMGSWISRLSPDLHNPGNSWSSINPSNRQWIFWPVVGRCVLLVVHNVYPHGQCHQCILRMEVGCWIKWYVIVSFANPLAARSFLLELFKWDMCLIPIIL